MPGKQLSYTKHLLKRQLRNTPPEDFIELTQEASASLLKLNWPERRKKLILPKPDPYSSPEEMADFSTMYNYMDRIFALMDVLANDSYRKIPRDQIEFLREAMPIVQEIGEHIIDVSAPRDETEMCSNGMLLTRMARVWSNIFAQLKIHNPSPGGGGIQI